MDSSVQLLGQHEPSRSFLDEAYQALGYKKGALFNALRLPISGASESEEWLEKGDWLALAQEVGAQKVFFVNNDPVIVFCELPSRHDIRAQIDMFRRAWCMARPQCLFMAFPDELRVYSLNRPPAQNMEEWKKIEPLELVKQIANVAEKLHEYRREQVESGRLFAENRFGSIGERADKRLIQDLKIIRQWLLDTGLDVKHTHALIGRSIFIRYLEDREILTPIYFEQVAKENPYWQELLSRKPEKLDLMSDWEKRRYYNVLLDKDFTYALFEQLARDFNGDMFPKDEEEKSKVDQKNHLEPLRGFLLGDADPQRPTLFFWAYDFKIIPIELISSIYEEFYHRSNIEDANGTYYTPSVLVEYILSQILIKERLKNNPKILDPACGSGVFLVESFRRIVRYQVKNQQRQLLSEELRQILRDQITGIEINEEAVRVAAFSLYLALLHYQEPRDILENKRLPNLIYLEDQKQDEHHYHILFNANAFGLTSEEKDALQKEVIQKRTFAGRANLQLVLNAEQNLDVKLHSFDVIVGNPPWSEISDYLKPLPCNNLPALNEVPKPFRYDKKHHTLSISAPLLPKHLERAKQLFPKEFHFLLDKLKLQSDECFQAVRWAEAYKKPVGDNSYSQLFIHRSLSFIKENGVIGLLVHSSVLFNERSTSQAFRQVLLSSSKIRQVVNFAHVRRLFFNKSVAPFVFISFEPSEGNTEDFYVIYASALLTKAAEQLRSVILTKTDCHILRQSNLQEKDYLWKTYWLGSHRDAALLATLDAEYRLQDFLSTDPKPGYGFQWGQNPPSRILQSLRVLKSKHLKWYGPLRDEWFEEKPSGVSRTPDERLYQGQRLLVGTGTKASYGINVRLEYEDFSFRHGLYCIPLPSLPEWKAKLILGIFWSSLGRYRLFMTSSRWGIWFDQVLSDDILSMPIRIPAQSSYTVRLVIQAVDALRAWEPWIYNSWFGGRKVLDEPPPDQLIEDLDKAVFELFRLSGAERDLVRDFFKYKFDILNRGASSTALDKVRRVLNTSQGTIHNLSGGEYKYNLESYLYTFLQMWNRELEPDGEFRWRVIYREDVGMVAVIFTTQTKGDTLPEIITSEEEEWKNILDRCAEALRQPVSQRIYIDGIVRAVTDTDIIIIKRNEQRLWTSSMAYEDGEATLLQATHLQSEALSESNR